MKIVIPMAGLGKRFLNAGYMDPKPLIVVDGKPIIEHVVNMFSKDDDFVFVCKKMHKETTNTESVLKRIAPNATIIWIDKFELGSVYNTTYAFDYIDNNEPVIVCYCDFYEWWDYDDFKRKMKETEADAAVTAYIGFHPHLLGDGLYAAMRVDADNWMLECREKHSFTKNKMDSFQQSGKFYFKTGAIMKNFFQECINKNLTVNNEFYVSVVTQLLVEAGLRVYVYAVEQFLQWGTPKDFEEYVWWSDFFRENKKEDPNWDENTLKTFNYWKRFFTKCPWHPYGKQKGN